MFSAPLTECAIPSLMDVGPVNPRSPEDTTVSRVRVSALQAQGPLTKACGSLGVTTGRGLWVQQDLGFSSDSDGNGGLSVSHVHLPRGPKWDELHGPDSPPAPISAPAPAK